MGSYGSMVYSHSSFIYHWWLFKLAYAASYLYLLTTQQKEKDKEN